MDLYSIRQKLNMGIPLTQIKLRVTDYSRVSTDHEEQKSSLKNQIEHFDNMIKKNPNWTYVKGYVDEGITGTSDIKRNNFMKMIEDGKNGKFDLIITKEISRFSRNTLDSIKYTRELLSNGVAVYFVNDNINTALPDSELRLTIMASMAQDEIRRLSERVKFGMNISIKRGNILGNDMLYGYKKNKQSGKLIIIEREAEIVQRMYRMYAIDKISISKIAKTLNSEGIKTRQNKKWCTSTIRRMLQNPKYKGYYCGKKTEIIDYMTKKVKMLPKSDWIIFEDKEKIPKIVDEELWQRANDRLETRNKRFGEDYKDKIMYSNRYPLSTKIHCAEDNEIFHRRKQCKDDITWCCANYLKNGITKCNSPNLRESELYYIFNDIIRELSININQVSAILLNIYKDNNSSNELEEIKKYTEEKEKILLKKEKLFELNLMGLISDIEFSNRNDKCNNELTKIESKLTTLEKQKNSYIDRNNRLINLDKEIKKQLKSQYTQEKLISLLLNKIEVSKVNNNKNTLKLKIFLNYSKDYLKKEINNTIEIMTKDYEFKRGYNKTSTKRYKIKYQVITYICL